MPAWSVGNDMPRIPSHTQTMRAVVYSEYGGPDVLRLGEVPKPTPKDDEVLIRVRATTVTAADGLVRAGVPLWGRLILGLRTPRKQVIGTELAGEIASIGSRVTRLKPGDDVYAFTGFGLGAYAEYCCMPERGSVMPMPANTTYEQAAALVDGASTSMFFLEEKVGLQPGQRVLINGASGSIGTYSIQLAKRLGAEVIGVCSARNHDLVKSLGADHVIDYAAEDFTTHRASYDVVFDTVAKSSYARSKRALKRGGAYISTDLSLPLILQSAWTSLVGHTRAVWGMSTEKRQALRAIKELVEAGELEPVVDRRYTLETITEAHRYVDTGHKRGNVVVGL